MTAVTDPIRGTSEPDRYWTSTNLGEACPDVMSPMCWSVWEGPEELGWQYSMYAFGVVPKKRVHVSPDVNQRGLSCFYGRQALNVDGIRETLANLPGMDPDDFERDLMGSVRPDAPAVKGSLKRLPVIMVKAPLALTRTSKRMHATHDRIRAWWLTEVYGVSRGQTTGTDPLEKLLTARDLFAEQFKVHCVWRFVFQGAQSAVTDAGTKAGDATLVTQLLSGVGDVNETRMADDLWRLGQGQIAEEDFLRDWGYHGPNEGNPYTTVWRENPGQVRTMAVSYARRDERPADRARRAQQLGEDAERRLLEATPALKRPTLRWLMRRVRNIIRTLQVGKAGYLMAIDGARAAAREFGAQQAAQAVLEEADDAFFLTIEECQELAAGRLPEARTIVEVRRATRADYKAMVLPTAFRGMPEPIVAAEVDAAGPVEFSGAAGGGGSAEGRARIVTDPAQDVDLDDGDVLVCRFTDPSWAPLMALSEALVIDIGGSASHGAVVARELGIPYVIGTEVGTRRLQEGDRILVDGDANLVRVLERAAASAEPATA
jgi:phosphohistidine swiveling domain-containing protein